MTRFQTNKKQEIPQQSLRVSWTFFYRKRFFYYSSCNRLERVLLEDKVIYKSGNPGVICSLYCTSILTSCQFTNEPNREISRGVFQNRGVCGQAFPLLPSPSPFYYFFLLLLSNFRALTRLETLGFFCSRPNFRALTRLETLAMQARFNHNYVSW